ncbi:MAG: polyamine aminopropyltransferase [Rhodocyclaceae bacterium]|jgi:spermidine synthase|nr:polyamine aminopropyltransferase [Rhodocyclaceae bacterium]
MALTDRSIRHAQASDKPRKLADGKGLYLLITRAGSKLWRMDYRFLGKRKTLSLGAYPGTTLQAAQAAREAARQALKAGTDPAARGREARHPGRDLAARAWDPARPDARPPAPGNGELLLEWLNPDSAFGFRATRRLEAVRTPYQTLEVFDTPQWGKLFRLDGRYMTSEGDEFFYHEAMVHPMAVSHPAPRTALVIGGGDGGSSEELLKHPSMERVVMAELDGEVVRIARAHLGAVHRGVFADPRLEVRIGDGWVLAEALAGQGERFDLIVFDLTDPDSPAHRLYTRAFFLLAKELLNPGGAISLHLGSPIFNPDQVRKLLANLAGVFRILRPLGLYIPLYGCYWGLAVASDGLDPLAADGARVARRLQARNILGLRYYNEEIHRALFALPNFYRDLLPPKAGEI